MEMKKTEKVAYFVESPAVLVSVIQVVVQFEWCRVFVLFVPLVTELHCFDLDLVRVNLNLVFFIQ